jgi:hypothetical protein
MTTFRSTFPHQEGESLVITPEPVTKSREPYIPIEVLIRKSDSTTKILRKVIKWLRQNGWD